MEDVGVLYGHLIYFSAIWYIFRPFGIIYVFCIIIPVLVCCPKKNLATLIGGKKQVSKPQLVAIYISSEWAPIYVSHFCTICNVQGLPEFSWYNKPKRKKYTKMSTKLPNGHETYQNGQ
jgi:hypothetical protein